jgi:hypothetical protein
MPVKASVLAVSSIINMGTGTNNTAVYGFLTWITSFVATGWESCTAY